MIPVGSNVLVEYLRKREAKLLNLFSTLPVAVAGMMRAEVLAGSKGPADRARLVNFLAPFVLVSMPDPLWDAVGDNYLHLRSRGITVPIQDVIIATLAIASGYELWARGHHYPMMQTVLPAPRLFVEPP